MVLRSRISILTQPDGFLADEFFSFSADSFSGLGIAVGDHDVCSALGCEEGDFTTDAAAAADDHHDAAGELFLGRLTADLGFFELPVLDAEASLGGRAT